MADQSIARLTDRMRLADTADWLAVATAVSLPWSTSATGILLVLLLLAFIPTLEWADLRRELVTPAGALPVLLVALGVLGMAWADVTLTERWGGVGSFFKLLVIPLLLVQFRRSERGWWVLGGYLWSCIALILASAIVIAIPPLSASLMHYDNVLVKNAATQSGEFVTCIFGLLFVVPECVERRRWWWLAGLTAIMFGMLANMFYVATGRTALVIIPVLLVLFAAKKLNGKGVAVLFACVIAVGVAGWLSSPYLRERTVDLWTGYQKYEASDEVNVVRPTHRILQELASIYIARRRFSGMARERSEPCSSKQPAARLARPVRSPTIRTIRHSRSPSRLGSSAHSCCGRCGSRICCYSAAAGWWNGSGSSSSCRISSARCSTRICSISGRAGSMCWASASLAAWR